MKPKTNRRLIQWATAVMVALYVFSLGGYYVVFGIMQYQAKQTMSNLVKAHSANYKLLGLEKIHFHKKNESKVNDGDEEFVYKGKLYDVVYSTTANDSISLYCYWDQNEESVVGALQNYQLMNSGTQENGAQKGLNNIIKFLGQPAIIEADDFVFTNYSTSYISFYQNKASIDLIEEINPPPPKTA